MRLLISYLIGLAMFAVSCAGEQPSVTGSIPGPGQTGVEKDQKITISFSKKIDKQKCISAFSLQPAIRGFFSSTDDSITFTSSDLLESGNTYIFSVNQNCEDRDGRDIKEPYIASFSVGDEITPPSVISALAKQNSTGCLDSDPDVEIANFQTNTYNSDDFCDSTDIIVRFSEPMNRSSVEKNFTSNPPLNGSFIWSDNEDQLTFNPMSALHNGVTYVFTIGSESKDNSENELDSSVTFSFTIGTDFDSPKVCEGNIIRGSPAQLCGSTGNSVNVPPQGDIGTACSGSTNDSIVNVKTSCRTTPIEIQFSEDMDIGKTINALSIGPSISYTTYWEDSDLNGKEDKIIIQPSHSLKNNTYTVLINTTAQDIAGNTISKPYSFSFTVPFSGDIYPPGLEPGSEVNGDLSACAGTGATVIADFQPNVCNQQNGIIFQFNFTENMNRTKTSQALGFYPSVNGAISWSGSTMIFSPSEDLQKDKQYTITIRYSAEDLEGNPLPEDFVRYFSTGGDGAPPELTPGNEVTVDVSSCDSTPDTVITDFLTGVCFSQNQVIFQFNFSEAMDTSQTSSSISFSPNINGEYSWSGNTLTFAPNEDLKINTQYHLTVSRGAMDISGNSMEKEFTRYFNTIAGDNEGPSIIGVNTDAESGAGGCDSNLDDNINGLYVQDICVDSGGTGNGSRFQIVFNEAMDINSTINAFSISPSVEGSSSLQNGNTELIFLASKALEPGTQYKLSLSTSAKDANLNPLQDELNLFFETSTTNGNPVISSINILTGISVFPVCDNIVIDLVAAPPVVNNVCEVDSLGAIYPIDITFSEAMNQISTNNAFSISPNIDGVINWPAANNMRFLPNKKLEYGARYKLTFSRSTEDGQGHKLENKYEVFFIVGAEDNVSPSASDIQVNFEQLDGDGCSVLPNGNLSKIQNTASDTPDAVCVGRPIVIDFDRFDTGDIYMKPTETQNAVSLSPAVNVAYSWNSTYSQLTITPMENLESGKEYLLTVSTSAQDYAGNSLDNDFLIGFLTEDTSPRIIAMGLESQGDDTIDQGAETDDLCTLSGYSSEDYGDNRGTSTSTACWWREGQDILSANNYTFGGDYRGTGAGCLDQVTDNFRIIFSQDMEPYSTVDAISITRVSLPSSTVKIVEWHWDSLVNPRVLTLKAAESLNDVCDSSTISFSGTDPEYNMAGTFGIYLFQIDTGAKDLQGNSLSSQFNFPMQEETEPEE